MLKSGFPAWGVTGDPNSSVAFSQPLVMGPQFGGHGGAAADLSVAYVSEAALAVGGDHMPTRRTRVAVKNTRSVDLTSMVRHGRLGAVEVDAATAEVSLDGEVLHSEPAESVALSRRYYL